MSLPRTLKNTRKRWPEYLKDYSQLSPPYNQISVNFHDWRWVPWTHYQRGWNQTRPKKALSVQAYSPPKTQTQIRVFLGRFIAEFSRSPETLSDLLKKNHAFQMDWGTTKKLRGPYKCSLYGSSTSTFRFWKTLHPDDWRLWLCSRSSPFLGRSGERWTHRLHVENDETQRKKLHYDWKRVLSSNFWRITFQTIPILMVIYSYQRPWATTMDRLRKTSDG